MYKILNQYQPIPTNNRHQYCPNDDICTYAPFAWTKLFYKKIKYGKLISKLNKYITICMYI